MPKLEYRLDGKRLRHERLAQGLTLEDLASDSKLALRAISNIERGLTRAVRADTLEKLAAALSMNPGALLRGHLLDTLEPLGGPILGTAKAGVDLKDIRKIATFVAELHPSHEKGNELNEIFERWYNGNSQVFQFACHQSKERFTDRRIDALTVVLPLRQQTYARYSSGRISEWQIGLPGNEIDTQSSATAKFLLIQSIELRKELRRSFAGNRLIFHTLIRHLAIFCGEPNRVRPILIADGNEEGQHYLVKSGFSRIADPASGATTDPRPIYKLDFDERFPNVAQMRTLNALSHYMELYARS